MTWTCAGTIIPETGWEHLAFVIGYSVIIARLCRDDLWDDHKNDWGE